MSLLVRPFSKLLVANRGEIALRVMRTAADLGYRTVAVHSEADAGALHVRAADLAVCIGPPAPAESYLDIEALMEAARRTGADALHPGYGFLAENADLARRCAEEGLVFVGPPPEAIALMGDKAASKRRMAQAGVPVIPGYQGGAQDTATLAREAAAVGFPLLVKAVAGGGGRGMRVVREAAELSGLLESARSEARGAFGNGDLLLERLLEQARHVEIQVFADSQGSVVHLGERECSAQRRHQKIIEESPSPAVDPELRGRMGRAAVEAARAIGYVGAGTVELMLGPDREFYFLEMNTRLQVEHPVTELCTGEDLVAWQLAVAAGAPLPLTQEEIVLRGHAIEARLYAEDPFAGFLPRTGRVLRWRPAPGVRVDSGIAQGQEVTSHYDPLLAKLVAHGPDREVARRRLIRALEDTVLLGVGSNRRFLVDLLSDDLFVQGEVTTSTIDARFAERPPRAPAPSPRLWALAAVLRGGDGPAWRSTGERGWPVTLVSADDLQIWQVASRGGRRYRVSREGEEVEVALLETGADGRVRCELDGVQQTAWFAVGSADDGEQVHLQLEGQDALFCEPPVLRERTRQGGVSGQVLAPIPGKLLALDVAEGDTVARGQRLAVLEAMKMEHRVEATVNGTVKRVLVAAGDQVTARQLLVEIEPEPEPEEQGGDDVQ